MAVAPPLRPMQPVQVSIAALLFWASPPLAQAAAAAPATAVQEGSCAAEEGGSGPCGALGFECLERAASLGGSALERRSIPFASPSQLPPGDWGSIAALGSGRYLLTADIAPAELPYRTELRRARSVRLPKSLAGMPQAPVSRVTDVALASRFRRGTAGVVKLAELSNGTPVAFKSFVRAVGPVEAEERFLVEAQSAKLFSDLGIGPRFYGIYQDPGGERGIVTDVVRGDFIGAPVTDQTFQDLETILRRLREAGLEGVWDLQLHRTTEGRLLAVDAGKNARRVGVPADPPTDSIFGAFGRARFDLLQQASPRLAREYLAWLETNDPAAFRGIESQARKEAILPAGAGTPSRGEEPGRIGDASESPPPCRTSASGTQTVRILHPMCSVRPIE